MKPNTPDESDSAAEKARAEHFARKQKWKEQPGNRYTPEELRLMLENSPPLTIHHRRTKVMYLK